MDAVKFIKERISIHAPREGGDGGMCLHHPGRIISIHAPREGGDKFSQK